MAGVREVNLIFKVMTALEKRCREEVNSIPDFNVGIGDYDVLHGLHLDSDGVYVESAKFNFLGSLIFAVFAGFFGIVTRKQLPVLSVWLFAVCAILGVLSICILLLPKKSKTYLVKDGCVLIDDAGGVRLSDIKRFVVCTIRPGVSMLGGYTDASTYYVSFIETKDSAFTIFYFNGVECYRNVVLFIGKAYGIEHIELILEPRANRYDPET